MFRSEKIAQKSDIPSYFSKMIMRFFSILCGKTDVHIEPFAVVFMYNEGEIIDSFYVYNDFNLQKRLTDFKILAFDFGIQDFG